MPTPTPQRAQPVEAIASYAHRAGPDIRLVLHLPRARHAGGGVRLLFRAAHGDPPETSVEADVAAADPGVVVTAQVPAERLPDGVWSLETVADGESGELLEARLLTSHTQPVALLPGPAPDMRMRPPRPRATPPGASRLRSLVPAPLKRVVRSVARLGRMGP